MFAWIVGGDHNVEVYVADYGRADGNVTFTYDITILSVSPAEGSSSGKTRMPCILNTTHAYIKALKLTIHSFYRWY